MSLSAVTVELKAGISEFKAKMAEAGQEVEKLSKKSAGHFDKLSAVGKTAFLGVAGAALAGGIAATKAAGDYQQSLTTLVTGAGESEKNIKLVGDGMLHMAGQVGISAKDLSAGMYLIESSGQHGANGLLVLRAAAEGAKVGAADMKTVADGLTTALTDYHLPAAQAAATTSKLVATVAAGKTTMGDLAGSLHNVLPAAAAAGIGLEQVLGAMATMTGQGISADQASQDLANTIRSLQAPSQVASKAMAAIGLNSLDVSHYLGKNGLTGTMDMLTHAITKNMGPAGLVIESSFNKSKLAASSANEMLSRLPKSLQKLGHEFLANQITQKDWMHALKGQDVLTANLGKEFASTAKTAHGFSETLRSGGGSSKTFSAVLGEVTGGATGLNTALALTGANAQTFADNVKSVSGATAEAGGHVRGFRMSQKDLNAQVDRLTASLSSMEIEIGQKLIPVVEKSAGWLVKHKTIMEALAGVVGGVLVVSITAYVASLVAAAASSVASFAKMVASGAVWVAEQLVGVGSVVAGYAVAFASMLVAAMAWAAGMLVAGAMALLPFLPIIAACAAVAAAAYLLYRHWDQVWGFIKSIAVSAWHWIDSNVVQPIEAGFAWVVRQIKAHWALIVGILTGPIGLVVAEIAKHWDQIVGTVAGLPGRIAGAASGMWDGIKNAFRAAINWIIGGWNGLHFSVPSISIPGLGSIGGGSFGVPQIPYLAKGGVVTRPTLAMIGEAGPEAVVPLSRGRAGMGQFGGGDVHITVQGFVGNESQLAMKIKDMLLDLRRQRGTALGLG